MKTRCFHAEFQLNFLRKAYTLFIRGATTWRESGGIADSFTVIMFLLPKSKWGREELELHDPTILILRRFNR